MVEDGRPTPVPPALHPDRRCEILILVLTAGFVLRSMNRLRLAFKGGLDGALVLLDLLAAERESRCGGACRAGPSPLPRRSITAIGVATGIPRETVRRLLAGLAAAGWLEAAAPLDYATSARTREWFVLAQASGVLTEFVWVASQVQAARTVRGEAVEALLARHPWRVALASEWQAPADPHIPALARVLEQRLRQAGADDAQRLAYPVDTFLCRHLKRLHRTFDGDLMTPFLIGEIAHRNVSVLARRDGAEDRLRRLSADPGVQAPETRVQYLRCNTHSLALSTGIPEATVRRKVARLAARGFVRVAADRSLAVDPVRVRACSGVMDAEALADLLETYETLCALAAAGCPVTPVASAGGR